jgi:tol-pal system protein YbgF
LRKTGESRYNPGFPSICLALLLTGLSLSGCATRNEIAGFQSDATYIRAKLDTLSRDVQNLRLQADGLQIRQDRLVEEMVTQSDLRQFRAYTSSRMDDYQAQGQMLSAQINDLSQRLTGVVQRMDESRYREKSAASDSTDSTAAIVGPEPQELYDQAYQDLSRGNYDLAGSGFEEYLKLYPDTELADNALYWLGEVQYIQHKYEPALEYFRQVESRYPQGNKVPAALFKVALCLQQLKQTEEAQSTFERLVQQYPGSPEAAQAKAKLK